MSFKSSGIFALGQMKDSKNKLQMAISVVIAQSCPLTYCMHAHYRNKEMILSKLKDRVVFLISDRFKMLSRMRVFLSTPPSAGLKQYCDLDELFIDFFFMHFLHN